MEAVESFKEKFKSFWAKFTDFSKKFWSRFVAILKKIWMWLLVVVITVMLMVGVTLYTSSIRSTLYKNSFDNVLEVTIQGTEAFNSYVDKDFDASQRLVDRLTSFNADDDAKINDVLKVIKLSTTIYRVTIVKPADGVEDIYRGKVYANYSLNCPPEDTEVLTKIEKPFADNSIDLSVAIDKDNENSVANYENIPNVRGLFDPMKKNYSNGVPEGVYMIYYQGFQFADGTVAVLQEYRDVNIVAEKFTLSFYNDKGKSRIVNKDGEVLVSKDAKFNNLFSLIRGGNSESALNKLQDVMAKDGKGAMTFKINGSNYVIAFKSVPKTDGWFMVSIVPSSAITANAEGIINTSMIFGLVIAFIVILVILLIFIFRRNKRVMVSKEAEIIYREQLFDILANNTDEVFVMISTDDMSVDYVSPNVERVLGFHPKDVKKSLDILGKAKYTKGEKIDNEALENLQVGSCLTFETERLHKVTNERRYFTEAVYRVRGEQNDKFIIAISDRTEELYSRQSLEEALNLAKDASKAKSTFLSNMSHDIKTPISDIVELCNTLEKDSGNKEKVKEYASKISLSGRHMLEIINDTLDITNIESGETSLNLAEINISEVIKELDDIIRPQTKEKGQSFNIVVAVHEGLFIGDRTRIKRLMLNILTNAVKYTPDGGRIDFTVRQMARASQKFVRIQFIVKDNGVGISAERQANLFVPFSQSSTAVDGEAKGSGLGLPIAKNLVDLMGGTMAVESKEGEGSTFTVNIKFRLPEDEEESDFWAEHGVEKIMFVGCSDTDCDEISKAMRDTDVSVSFAEDAESALSLAIQGQKNAKSFDVVLIDWQLPEDDRRTAFEELRKILPTRSPIFAFGEHDWSETESLAIESGMVKAFIEKPFSLAAFMENIQKAK